MPTTTHPFDVDEPGNVPLAQAPLVRTIAQIRFPHLTQFAIGEEAVASGVAKVLAEDYPLMEVGQEVSVTITPEGVNENRSGSRLWRLTSADRTWQISFSGSFISIDTRQYVQRSDFARRLTDAWDALNEQVRVPFIQRLGVRYVNHISDPDLLKRLPELLRPEVLGAATAQDPVGAALASAMCESQYRFQDGAGFHARWGLLPAGASIDAEVPARDYPTWMLDMDSFREWPPGEQSGSDVYENVRELALRGYQFFRWAVTDEFLSTFGGQHDRDH